MRARRLAIQLGPAVVLSALTAVAALAGSAAETAPAAKTKPQWQLFPGAKMDVGRPLLAFGWAANRVWVVAPYKEDPILWSARVSGSALAGFMTTRVPADASRLFPIADGALVLGDVQRTDAYFAAPLLANGRLGASKAVADDLLARARERAPRLARVGIEDGIRVADRTVWILSGAGTDKKGYLLACCSEGGAAGDVITRGSALLLFLQIGLDTRGRIWLAWLDTAGYAAARGVPRLVELDPSTLALRTELAVPGLIADRIELACAATCRVVAQSAAGDIVSWAPGERSPTRIASHYNWPKGAAQPYPYPAFLLAASYRSGRLVVAYQQRSRGRAGRDEIRVVRGDARGARSRVVGATIAIPNGWPPGKLYPPVSSLWPVYASFVPRGLVAIGTFQYTQAGAPSPVIGAFVPLAR